MSAGKETHIFLNKTYNKAFIGNINIANVGDKFDEIKAHVMKLFPTPDNEFLSPNLTTQDLIKMTEFLGLALGKIIDLTASEIAAHKSSKATIYNDTTKRNLELLSSIKKDFVGLLFDSCILVELRTTFELGQGEGAVVTTLTISNIYDKLSALLPQTDILFQSFNFHKSAKCLEIVTTYTYHLTKGLVEQVNLSTEKKAKAELARLLVKFQHLNKLCQTKLQAYETNLWKYFADAALEANAQINSKSYVANQGSLAISFNPTNPPLAMVFEDAYIQQLFLMLNAPKEAKESIFLKEAQVAYKAFLKKAQTYTTGKATTKLSTSDILVILQQLEKALKTHNPFVLPLLRSEAFKRLDAYIGAIETITTSIERTNVTANYEQSFNAEKQLKKEGDKEEEIKLKKATKVLTQKEEQAKKLEEEKTANRQKKIEEERIHIETKWKKEADEAAAQKLKREQDKAKHKAELAAKSAKAFVESVIKDETAKAAGLKPNAEHRSSMSLVLQQLHKEFPAIQQSFAESFEKRQKDWMMKAFDLFEKMLESDKNDFFATQQDLIEAMNFVGNPDVRAYLGKPPIVTSWIAPLTAEEMAKALSPQMAKTLSPKAEQAQAKQEQDAANQAITNALSIMGFTPTNNAAGIHQAKRGGYSADVQTTSPTSRLRPNAPSFTRHN